LEQVEEPFDGLLGAPLADPEEAAAVGLDLVDQGDVVLALLVGDFIDANRTDVVGVAVLEPPFDGCLDSTECGVLGACATESQAAVTPLA